ncbi:imidazolonepropionase [Acidimicrobiaceae bacterium]|nr:imidazolonepropionase [Acidimicrobiaceae bacterium]
MQRADVGSSQGGAAPPAVADHNASSQLIFMFKTASEITSGIDVVYDEPGLQSEASATVMPASSRRLASGNADRVHSSAVGKSVATVRPFVSARAENVCVVQVCAMIARSGAEVDAKLNATTVLQLIGVNAYAETCFGAGIKNCASAVDIKCSVIAKHIDPFCNWRTLLSISPQTRSTYSSIVDSGGTTCAPRKVVSEVITPATCSDLLRHLPRAHSRI